MDQSLNNQNYENQKTSIESRIEAMGFSKIMESQKTFKKETNGAIIKLIDDENQLIIINPDVSDEKIDWVDKIIAYNLERALMEWEMVPLNLDCTAIQLMISSCEGFQGKAPDIDQLKVENFNEQIADFLVKEINAVFKIMRIPVKQSITQIQHIIRQGVAMVKQIDFLSRRFEELKISIEETVTEFINTLYNSLDNIIVALIQSALPSEEFIEKKTLKRLFEKELYQLCLVFQDFKYQNSLQSVQLFQAVRDGLFCLIEDINLFFIEQSQICIDEMNRLEQLLSQHHSLANVKTFEVLQKETSQAIIQNISQKLNQTMFFREEFASYQQYFVKHSIGFLHDYNKKLHYTLKKPKYPNTLQQLFEKLEVNKCILVAPCFKQFKYTAEIKSSDLENIIVQGFLLSNPGSNLDYSSSRVIATQDFINISSNTIVACIQIENQGSYLLYVHDGIIYLRSTVWVSFSDFKPLNPIEETDQPLELFFQKRRLLSNFYDQDPNQKFEPKNNYQELTDIQKYEFEKFHKKEIRQLMPQNQKAFGNVSSGAMTGGCVGAGLGSLILDSLDDSISWDEKLRRAGQTTVQTGAISTIIITMPVVGQLLTQVFVAYMMKKTLSNKVVNQNVKMQNLGHLGVQTTVGIGSAIAGQMLIPIPVLGAVIGSAVGGIAAGLYQRIVIPKTKTSMIRMLEKMEKLIQPYGLVVYTDEVIKIMKISKEFINSSKPSDLTQSEWLTITLVNMVNELQFLQSLEHQEESLKIRKKMEAEPEKEELYLKKLEQLAKDNEGFDKKFEVWNQCREYIKREKIGTLIHAKNIGLFVDGMIQNFKI